MIKEKYIPLITVIFVVLAILIAITPLALNSDDTVISTEADYVNELFDKSKVMQINISIDNEQWDSLLENATAEEFVPCDITVNGETLNTVGIRCKGNSSLSQVANNDTTDRFSFKIDFSEYISGQNLYGLDSMVLNNNISDPTYMKEYLSYEMMAEIGVNTPAYSYANIKVNGEDWGLYLAVELLEEDFLTRYYGTNYGNLYKPESTGRGQYNKNGFDRPDMPQGIPDIGEQSQSENLTDNNTDQTNDDQANNARNGNMPQDIPNMGGGNSGTNLVYTDDNLSSYQSIFDNTITKSTTDADKKLVIEMIKNLNSGTNLEKYLDVDQILRYFAVNTFLVNLDSYTGSMKHNYYLYEQNDIFQILPWDFNLSFGSFQMNDASKVINFPIDAPVTDTMENSPLISKLLEVDEYKELYHQHLQNLIDTYITSGKFDSEIDRVDSLISQYVESDATAFYSYEQYKNSIPELKTYGTDRAKSILAQLTGEQPSTSYGDIETSLNLSVFGSMGGGDRDKGDFGGDNRNNPNMNSDKIEFDQTKNPDTDENLPTQSKPMQRMDKNNKSTDDNFNTANMSSNILYLITYVLLIFSGLFFVIKYKRKKNH